MAKIDHAELGSDTRAFFVRTIDILDEAEVPFLLGGAYALSHYTGIARHTKDLDVFVRPSHCHTVLDILGESGYETELTFEDWLGKAVCDDDFIDIIFSSRNRIAIVDDEWFDHAETAQLFDRQVMLSPPEETIWSKAFIMERERYDGADIAHLLHARADELDWDRMMRRFEPYWRVLFSHLVLFGFIYPGDRDRIPQWVMERLTERLTREGASPATGDRLCRGTILSGEQYRPDVEEWGYEDVLMRREREKGS